MAEPALLEGVAEEIKLKGGGVMAVSIGRATE